MLIDNAIEQETFVYLEKTCEWLPKPDYFLSHIYFMDSYFQDVLDTIKKQMGHPRDVCSALSFCESL